MTSEQPNTYTMSVYYTEFKKKTVSVRNNVKNSMIKNFIHSLGEAIDDRTTSVSHIHSVVSGFVIPQYDKNGVDPLSICDQIKSMPCLNMECEWINYQTIFYPDRDLWQLPAYTDAGMCILCSMWIKRELDISQISMSSKHKVILHHDKII
jgi:hypothetical protein